MARHPNTPTATGAPPAELVMIHFQFTERPSQTSRDWERTTPLLKAIGFNLGCESCGQVGVQVDRHGLYLPLTLQLLSQPNAS
jgi:hypothetical protein